MLTPGPKEPTGSELQEFNRLLVDDLIELEDLGILVGCSASRPNGSCLKFVL
jgi:hypothetical protein